MRRKVIASAALLSLFIAGCANQPQQPVNHEVLKLDLIKPKDVEKKLNKTIIVLKPKIKILQSSNYQRMDLRSQILRLQENIVGGNYDFNQAFEKKYGNIVANSLKDDISDILLNDGFLDNAEYEDYDSIDFSVKQNAYLAIQPSIDISFTTNNAKKKTVGDTLYESGVVNVVGYIKLQYLEPLSKTQLSIKKINISDLNINMPYTSIRKIDSAYSHSSAFGIGKAIGKSIGNALFGQKEVDNTDDVLISIINRIESYSIHKIKSYLKTNNLLSYAEYIKEIKAKKRY